MTERLRKAGTEAVFPEGGLKAWTGGGQPVVNMRSSASYRIDDADIALLRRAGVAAPDIAHSLEAAEKAPEVAGRTDPPLDLDIKQPKATATFE
jgi:hypothetical protein